VAAPRRSYGTPRRLGYRVGLVVLLIAMIAGAAVLAITSPGSHRVTVVRVVTSGGSDAAGSSAFVPHRTYTGSNGAAAPLAPDPRQLSPATATGAVPGTVPGPASSSGLFRGGTHASFARLSASLPGRVQIAVAPLGVGRIETLGGDAPAHGWSTTKVPVLVALLRSRGPSGLTAQEQQWAMAAITASDNQSVLDLFGDLERARGGLVGASDYVQNLFRLSGDQQTVVATAPPPTGAVTTFGQTEWAPTQAVRFFRALGQGCLLSRTESSYVIGLMQSIVSSESWGLGSAGFRTRVAFKGGWGPEPSGNYLVRQSGIIDAGSTRGVAVSIVAYPSGGSFGAGTQMLTQSARWLRSELRLVPRASASCNR
jgi:hypothetical protein